MIHYHVVMVESADQADSLAHYLRAHGVAAVTDDNSVSISVDPDNSECMTCISLLTRSWELFFQHTDSGVLELPAYTKSACTL